MRDLDWDTIGGVERETSVEHEEHGFTVRSRVRNRGGPIDFAWEGLIEGRSHGTITYGLDGGCEARFQFAKIAHLRPPPSARVRQRPAGTVPLDSGHAVPVYNLFATTSRRPTVEQLRPAAARHNTPFSRGHDVTVLTGNLTHEPLTVELAPLGLALQVGPCAMRMLWEPAQCTAA